MCKSFVQVRVCVTTEYITRCHVRQDHTFHTVYTRTYLSTILEQTFQSYLYTKFLISYEDHSILIFITVEYSQYAEIKQYQKYQKYQHGNKSKSVPIRPKVVIRHDQHARKNFRSGEENMVERRVGFP